jgi:hypothetical protein
MGGLLQMLPTQCGEGPGSYTRPTPVREDTALPEITGFHAHVYFTQDTMAQARRLCEAARDRFDVAMGRRHERPVHTRCGAVSSPSVLASPYAPASYKTWIAGLQGPKLKCVDLSRRKELSSVRWGTLTSTS